IRQPYLAKPAHDRTATDLTRLAQVAPLEVDDPMGLDPGDKIVVMRSTRCDPLAAMHSRRGIDDASYHAGRAYQHDFETAERGPQAIDPSKEYVDGGKPPEPITDRQKQAVQRLAGADRRLGQSGAALIRSFLIDGRTMEQICLIRGLFGVREKLYIGRRIRECLNELAVIYGLATGERS